MAVGSILMMVVVVVGRGGRRGLKGGRGVVGRSQKIKKIKLAKNPLTQSPKKQNLDQNINVKSNTWTSFLKKLFWAYNFIKKYHQKLNHFYQAKKNDNLFDNYIFVHKFQWKSSVYFYFQIFQKKISSPTKKPAKKITHFTIQFCSKNLTHSMTLNSLDIEKGMLSQHSQKSLSLQ